MSTTSRAFLPWAVLATVGAIAVASAATQASNPFIAGQRSTEERPLLPERAARVAERARAVGRLLGLPSATVHATRVVDRFEQHEVDRATFTTPDGREVAMVDFDDAERVHLALRLGAGPGKGPRIAAGRASDRARGLTRDLGFDVIGQPAIDDNPSIGGWLVYWPRLVDGFTVKGDGLRVGLSTNGSFDSFARWEHPLAARPATVVALEIARSAAESWLDERFGAAASAYEITEMSVAWVAPNDTWDPAKPDAPDPLRQLAWIARADAIDPASAPVRAIQVWFDASDLSVIGGDVAQ